MNASKKNQRIVKSYFFASLGFGILMGLMFPVYAGFFVTFKSPVHESIFTLGCVFAGLMVGLFGFLIGKLTILKNIEKIAARFADLCEHEGDLTRDIDIVSNDGLGRLSANFNRFQEKLRTILTRLFEITDQTQQVGFSLAANITQTTSAAEQISSHMTLIDEQTELLVSEVENVDAARERINDSTTLVTTNIDRQSEALTKLSSIIEESMMGIKDIAAASDGNARSIIQILTHSSQNLEEIVRIAGKIGEINESIEKIRLLVAEINDTTERINVLGINASIEASHAGEIGKGFRVIANEIRTLADKAKSNSAHINNQIALVTGQVHEGVSISVSTQDNLGKKLDEMRENADNIREVTEKLTAFAARADEMILAHAGLVRVTIDVTNSMIEMRDSTDDIGNSMQILLTTAERNKLAIDEISLGMKEIATDVVELNKISNLNADNVRTLGTLTTKFKIQ